MALGLEDPDTDRLARQVAQLTGESLTQAVRTPLAERLQREQAKRGRPGSLADELKAIVGRGDRLPARDNRTAEEILEYDKNGLPS